MYEDKLNRRHRRELSPAGAESRATAANFHFNVRVVIVIAMMSTGSSVVVVVLIVVEACCGSRRYSRCGNGCHSRRLMARRRTAMKIGTGGATTTSTQHGNIRRFVVVACRKGAAIRRRTASNYFAVLTLTMTAQIHFPLEGLIAQPA